MSDKEILRAVMPLLRERKGQSRNDLGNIIGVTRQTIYNIETIAGYMSKTQYIAIRSVLTDNGRDIEANDIIERAGHNQSVLAFYIGAAMTNLDNNLLEEGLKQLEDM